MTAPAEDLVEVIAPAGTAAAAGYRIGRIVELSGQTGHRPDLSLPGTLGEEVDQAFQNITVALEAAGAAYLAGRPPAWTAVGVAALAQPGMHIEIEAKAAV